MQMELKGERGLADREGRHEDALRAVELLLAEFPEDRW
jgi:hypothetical protein